MPGRDEIGQNAADAYDAFMSHASEDKDLARPLSERLVRYSARIWFDEFELKPGDSLVAKIDKGLSRSAYGILILSPAFLSKPWPEYERQGLTNRDVARGGGRLLPVWFGVDAEALDEFSPTLAQRFALDATSMSIDELALRLLEVIRPELAEGPRRRQIFEELVAGAPIETVPLVDLHQPEQPVHDNLSPDLLRRIRLIQESLFEVFPISFGDAVGNFKRDLHPDREVEVWEAIAGTYLAIVRDAGVHGVEARKQVFGLVLAGYSGAPLDDLPVDHLAPDLVSAIRAGVDRAPRS